MADEWTAPLTIEQMYGDWEVECDEAMALTDRSLNPRSKTSIYDTLSALAPSLGDGDLDLDVGGRDATDGLAIAERFGYRVIVVDPVQLNLEDARRAVEAVKYHPQGRRGLAAGTRPSGYGFAGAMADYVAAANRETLVCVQIEDEEAVRNADEILRVEGIDVFFIGPSDLSQSMGHPGDPKAAPVRDAIDATLAKIRAAGKIPGLPGSSESLRDIQDKGARYIYTHLTRLLARGSADFLSAARANQK